MLSLLLASTLAEAWGLETGECKNKRDVHFPPFLLRSLTEETGFEARARSLMGLVS